MKQLLYSFFSLILSLFLISSQNISSATTVNIGILTELKISSLILSAHYGDYYLYGDGNRIILISGNESLLCQVKEDSVLVKKQNTTIGTYKIVKLIGKNAPNSFNIKPMKPEKPLTIFDHNLDLSVSNKFFKIINRVNIEYYVAGVVEAENGISQNYEYYRMKSIICRTYALNNLRRHEAEEYNLCNTVHCQVYKAKNRHNDDILMAAFATTGMVIVDTNLQLITAAFHSNCGGQTVNSESVWSLPTSYLKSVDDTFCLNMPHATWEHRINKNDWLNYLKKDFPILSDSASTCCNLTYSQNRREIDFLNDSLRIPLKKIRNDFRLKSTFFVFEPHGDSILLKGKGFGHGVGLCQEGAMRMAKLGFKFNEILHFYYKDVYLVDLSVINSNQ
ncbi:MAG: SpoIID/LytB domain-containing protein [Bacteroidetes bacterium]|nr:SpoIID/LytB domain-containing protein [Bacteroidota bacterium]HET6245222.1 SpoIID/LytB domain-containing protein [Bacteroidia bacterium]